MEIFGLSHKQHALLCNMLHFALMDICRLAWNGQTKQAGDLANVFLNAPFAFSKGGLWILSAMREELEHYQARYHNDKDFWRKTNYLETLDEIERENKCQSLIT